MEKIPYKCCQKWLTKREIKMYMKMQPAMQWIKQSATALYRVHYLLLQ